MKRILTFCITLFMVIGVFPISFSAAAEISDARSLYVTDGLKVQCLAFDNENVPTSAVWSGDVGKTGLNGSWERKEGGKGISYANKSAVSAGISIPTEYLGGSYTIETVITPLGVINGETDERQQGEIARDSVLQLGAFKAYGYCGVNTPNTSLAFRYYYAPSGGYKNDEYVTWNSFLGYGMSDLLTYTVKHTTDGQSSLYQVLHDGVTANVMTVSSEDYVPFEMTDGRAQLFCYFPIDLYAVRVYDRALSEAELAQNHFADLLLYHGVDVSLFWNLLDEEERNALMLSAQDISFNDGAEALGRCISTYLYDEAEIGTEAFRALAKAYALDLFPYLASENRGAVEKALAFVPSEGRDADAVQLLLNTEAVGENILNKLLAFSHFDSSSNEEPEISAVFEVNGGLLELLSDVYTISFGALVGSADVYESFESLSLNEDGKAPVNAAAYKAGKEDEEGFRFTVYWNEEHQNKKDLRRKVLFRGFLTYTDQNGKTETFYVNGEEKYDYYGNEKSISDLSMYSAARYFVSEYAGDYLEAYRYYHHAVLRDVLFTCGYSIPARDEEFAAADRLTELQDALKAGLEEALSVENVLYTKTSSAITDEKSIWVEYLAESVASDSRIRPAYIYFPTVYDPTRKSQTELKESGVYRVFCYIGMPEGDDTVPGIMCVHGGGGHAYINYVKEAVNHGYAAIAIDCDGMTRSDPTAGDYAGGHILDYLGMAKDSLKDSHRDINEQWMYYVQRALIYANTVLRSFDRVDEDAVGITGISWGGLTTSIAIGYDARYAFAVPVYLSGNMDESMGSWSADFYIKGLWYNDELLHASEVPTLIINSDGDKFASLNTNALTYHDLPNGEMCILPAYPHSQQHGASISEIYAYGNYITGYGVQNMITLSHTPTEKDGRDYTVSFVANSALTDYTATLYYLTEPVSYQNGVMRKEWQTVALTVEDGKLHVVVPEEACVYYVSFTAYSKAEDKMPTVYFEYDGVMYGSTPLISVGSKDIYS